MRQSRVLGSLAIVLALLPCRGAYAATYYVRTDGGTASQCTGLVDAAYPGSGAGQPCGWSHPFWALDGGGNWRISGGDTIVVGPGNYMMGFGAPNTSGWCDSAGAFACHLPPLPSGSAAMPTRVAGKGWSAGCANPPELWGTERTDMVLNLDGSSNVELDCLEVTDHSACVEFHANAAVECERNNYPYGEWASGAIYAADSSSVIVRDLNVHGLANYGVLAGRLTDWTVERTRIAGNGWVGWNGDLGGPSGNGGAMTFRFLTVEWNGCAETYPGQQPDHCWAQQMGGYGDGLGTGATAGNWTFEDSTFRYNTSDGLDMLYVGNGGIGGRVDVRRTLATSNAGDQIKVGGAATVVNSVMVSRCSFFDNQPFGQEMVAGDHCRAGGSAIVVDLEPGAQAALVNDTISGEGDCLAIFECNSCTGGGSEAVTMVNSVLQGHVDWFQPWEQSCFMWDPAGLATGNHDYNVVFDAKDDNNDCAAGGNNLCGQDPLLVDAALGSFDGHLRVGSPAIDNGLAVGSLGGLVPDHDFEGGARPTGAGVDRGAYEYGSTSGQDRCLVGMGLGFANDNRVRTYSAAGAGPYADFLAYGAGQWGVNVAAADIDGGSSDEILTGPGPGAVYGPQVRGFGAAGAAVAKVNFFAYGTLRFGVNASAGDVDRDGFEEILSGAGPGAVFGPHLRGFDYDGTLLLPIARISFFTYGTLRYGVNPADADVDGDGFAEIVSGPGPGTVFGPQVRGFDYDGTTVRAIATLNFNAFAVPQWGANVAGGDADGDGRGELAVAPGPGPSPSFPARFLGFNHDGGSVAALAGYDVTPFASIYGGRVGLADLLADGGEDLLAGPGRDPAAGATVSSFDYDGASLPSIGTFTAFTGAAYGVNVAGGSL